MARGEGISFIAHFYLWTVVSSKFFFLFFYRVIYQVFLHNTHNLHSCSFKYSDLIQIIIWFLVIISFQ